MSRLGYWAGVAGRAGWLAADCARHLTGAIGALPNPLKLANHVPYLLAPGLRENIEFWPAHEAATPPERKATLETLFKDWRDALKADGLVARDFSLAPINSGVLIPEDRGDITPQRVFNNLAHRHIAFHTNGMIFPDNHEFTATVRYEMVDTGAKGITIKLAGDDSEECAPLVNYMYSDFLPSFRILIAAPSDPERRLIVSHQPDMVFTKLAARAVFEGKLGLEGFTHEGMSADGKSASLLRNNDYSAVATPLFAERLDRKLHNPRLTLKDWG
jgi:hypothetical protein